MTITSVLSQYVRKLARSEIKPLITDARKRTSEHRRAIAALKRQLAAVTRELASVRKHLPSAPKLDKVDEEHGKYRLRVDGLKKHRERLGLSAKDFGKLAGVSALTVYNWESGKSKPRRKQLPRLAKVRELGKKEAVQALHMMKVD